MGYRGTSEIPWCPKSVLGPIWEITHRFLCRVSGPGALSPILSGWFAGNPCSIIKMVTATEREELILDLCFVPYFAYLSSQILAFTLVKWDHTETVRPTLDVARESTSCGVWHRWGAEGAGCLLTPFGKQIQLKILSVGPDVLTAGKDWAPPIADWKVELAESESSPRD